MAPLFQTYASVSPAVKYQLDRLTRLWQRQCGEDLLAVYLHGSMALGRFQEAGSDLDLLILVRRPLPRAQRLAIAREILEADRRPCPVELSALRLEDLHPWRHLARCQFHYSGAWTEHYRNLLSGQLRESFLVDTDFPDPDIACHVRLTRERGIPLYGPPAAELLPAVPEADFWQSIRADASDCGLLTLARILFYQEERRILSKYDAGLWAMEVVPERWRYLVENALREKYGGAAGLAYNGEDLAGLRQYLIGQIREKL